MTDAAYIGRFAPLPKRQTVSDVRPAPQPLGPPVFIHDCVTPLAGETLLSLLMKRLARDGEGGDQT